MNTTYRRYIGVGIVALSVLLSSASISFGQTTGSAPPRTVILQNPLKVTSLGAAVGLGIQIFTYLVILGAVIAFIIVGLRFILARGNPEKLKEASRWLWYIIIGVTIVIGARVMIQIIIATLQASGAVNSDIINSAQNALK